MHSGKAAGPVSLFVHKVGPLFLSGTSNMLILFWVIVSSCLYFFREELRSVSETPSAPCGRPSVCVEGVEVIISPVSNLLFPTSYGALAHCFSGFKHILRHAVASGITRKNPGAIAKVKTLCMLIMSCFWRAGLADHDDASHGLEEDVTTS